MAFGPFDITADRIAALGPRFTEFVNRLLDLERRARGLAGYQLTVNIIETTADGGVDAATRQAPQGDWIPEGDTAWQFKRSNLGPKACADEFADAEWAHEFMRGGGSYVIAMMVALPDNLIEDRRKRVADKAKELGLLAADDPQRIRVYDANAIARWSSQFPSLAVSQVAGGPGQGAIDFDSWSKKGPYQSRWTPDDARDIAITDIRRHIKSPGAIEMRIQGESGIGKTRLVLEALRDEELRSLVAYVDDERAVDSRLIEHLIEDGRTAILVVDECAADRHIKMVARLPEGSLVKLITIGEPGGVATASPIVSVGLMPTESTDDFLKKQYPQFSAEHRRFITDHGQGFMRWIIVLAQRLLSVDSAQAVELIARDDIEQFVTGLLPGGQDFFCASVLALFERVGWEGDLRYQLETISDFAGVSIEAFKRAGRELEQRGLLTRQGRFRAITPHPLAVFLAAEAWRSEGDRIASELLPKLDYFMALALFRRIAHLGSFEPARTVFSTLLSEPAPFSSLERIESGGLSSLLVQLAIVLPDEVAVHLGELIEGASLDELQALTHSKQNLVWTLEKLVWHRRIFESAANSLLKLALAEPREDRNAPATRTWLELFGAMLPGTAAVPLQRSSYLEGVVGGPNPEARLLAVRAASHMLVSHETIAVSGELQGGVLVEPRGTPSTHGELADYRRAGIGFLSTLLDDADTQVAGAAEKILIDALQPLIADPSVGEALADVLVRLEGSSLRRLRQSAEHVVSMLERYPSQDNLVVERIRALLDRLPAPSELDELEVLIHLNRWRLGEGELQRRVDELVQSLTSEVQKRTLLDLLSEADLPAAWELGHALAVAFGKDAEVQDQLLTIHSVNLEALIGYLAGLTEVGNEAAFDNFVTSESAGRLDLKSQLRVAVRGPVSSVARHQIMTGVSQLGVIDGIAALFGWQRNISAEEALLLFNDWSARIASQDDYNAVVDWLGFWLFGKEETPAELKESLCELLLHRREYPELSQQQWTWCQLAGRIVDSCGVQLARLILDLVDAQVLIISQDQEEGKLLRNCLREHPEEVWAELAARLTQQSWRLQMEARGWLLNELPSTIVEEWVGTSIERARIVASIASAGGDEPTAVARFLLAAFGEDQEVKASLYGQFISGFWWGPESERIAGQIEQLTKWRRSSTEPLAVRAWAREVIQELEERRRVVLLREAEGDF
jgi:hypothetical protein